MIKVLVVDDHAIVRRGIKGLVANIPKVSVADGAESGKEALKKLSAFDYDVVLLDIAMPGESGLEILKQIKRQKAKLPVIMLSMYSEEHYVFRAMKSGASGYLSKDNSPDELADAINAVFSGKTYISKDIEEFLSSEKQTEGNEPLHSRLSDREFQIMHLIASGKSVKTIATELTLSVKTVSTHRANILTKMRMNNNSELTHYAFKEGIIK